MRLLLFFFIVIFRSLLVSSQNINCGQVMLQKNLEFIDCQKLQSNSLLPQGNKILLQSNEIVKKLTFKGWFSLQGKNSQNYVIFEVKNLGVNVFKLMYDQSQMKFRNIVFDQPPIYTPVISSDLLVLYQSWFFIEFGLNLADSQPGNLYWYFLIQSTQLINGNKQFQYMGNNPTSINQFDNKTFEVFIGQTSTVGLSFGCFFAKQVVAFINKAYDSAETFQLFKLQDMSLDAEIQVNIDFSIQPKSQDFLLNMAQQNQRILIQKNSLLEEFNSLHSEEFIQIDPVNLFERDGIMLVFDIKIIDYQLQNINEIFKIQIHDPQYLGNYYSVQLLKTSTSSGVLEYKEFNSKFTSNIPFNIQTNVWVKVMLLLNVNFGQVFRSIYINGVQIGNSLELSFPQNGNLYFQFFNNVIPSLQKLLFRSIKIYKGTNYFDCGNCLVQVKRDGSDCLTCQSGLTLTYEEFPRCVINILSCPSGYSDVDSNNSCIRTDQTPCSQDNQYKFYNSNCNCGQGYYLSMGKCWRCPEYCLSCSDQNTCNQFNEIMRTNKMCPNKYYDDGFYCISTDKFRIINENNYIEPPLIDGVQCQNNYLSADWDSYKIQDKAFEIKDRSTAFVFSFRLQINEQNHIAGTTYMIGFLRANEVDIFSIVSKRLTRQYGEVLFYYLNQLTFSFPFYYGKSTSFRIITDLDYLIIQTSSKQQPVQTYKTSLKDKTTKSLTNPRFWFGIGKSKFRLTDYTMCGYIFNYNMVFAVDNIRQISDQEILEFKRYGIEKRFDYNFSKLKQIDQKEKTSYQYDQSYLILNNKPNEYDQVKGIPINRKNGAYYSINQYQLELFFFTCTVYFPDQQENIFIFQVIYDISNKFLQVITYRILTSRTPNKAHLEICIMGSCQILYNIINSSEPNIIFIRHENMQITFDFNIPYTEVNVVVNYQYRLLKFNTAYSNSIDFSKIIAYANIPKTDQDDKILYFMNRIKIYNGGFYKIDYTEYSNCFLYIDISKMICLIPKRGYALLNKDIVPSIQCSLQPLTISNTQLYYNPYTLNCEDSFNYFPNCVEILYTDLNSCSKCIDTFMIIVNGQCECQRGMFWNIKTKKCQLCSFLCLECSGTEANCTICKNNESIPPKCICPHQNQFLDNNYNCQQCDNKCETCTERADICTKCAKNRIFPLCECNQKYFQYSLDINKPCVQIECKFQCTTCTYSSENCYQCRGNRINDPQCICPENYYESNPPKEDCIPCPSQTYYDEIANKCLSCHESCLECRGGKSTDCKQCSKQLLLTPQNQCQCDNGDSPFKDANNQITCFDNFDINYELAYQKTYYILVIKFEQQLEGIKNNDVFNQNINFEISEIPTNFYSLKFHSYDDINAVLMIKLIVSTSFNATRGFLLFRSNLPFINRTKQKILNPIYTKIPIVFNIGPYLFTLDKFSQEFVSSVNETIDQMEESNKNLLAFIRNIQFLFYFINSLQPTAMFLLVKAYLPQNFYSFLQLFSTVVYKRVPDYQVQMKAYNFDVFNYHIPEKEYIGPGNQVLVQLAFSDSILANISFIIIKYIALMLIYLLVKYIKKIKNLQKHINFSNYQTIQSNKNLYQRNLTNISLLQNYSSQNFTAQKIPQSNNDKQILKSLYSIEQFIINRFHQENEVNILMLMLSLCIQFKQTNEFNWVSRWSFYLAIIVLTIFIFFQIKYIIITNGDDKSKKMLFTHLYNLRLKKKKMKYRFLIKNYHVLGIIKKSVLILTLFFLVDFSMVVAVIGLMLNLISCIISLIIVPYKRILHNIVKVIGDAILTAIWSLIIYFIRFAPTHQNHLQIDQNKVDKFNFIGNIASLLVFLLNIIYLVQFLFDAVIYKFCSMCKTKKYYLMYQKAQPIREQQLNCDKSSFDKNQSGVINLNKSKILLKKQIFSKQSKSKHLDLIHVDLI